jgi:two-component system sensor histidine kinase KdpD
VALASLGLPLLTLALVRLRGTLGLESDVSLYLLAVVAVTLAGGRLPGVLTAIAAALLLNWFFVEPLHTFDVAQRDNVVALGVFLAVAAAVGALVDVAAERHATAARASARAEALREAAGGDAAARPTLAVVLERARRALAMDAVVLRRRSADGWQVVARAGSSDPSGAPANDVPAGEGLVLVTHGPPRLAADPEVARTWARAARDALEREHLVTADRQRSALLAAVGHDLRTPLASIKAAVGTLRDERLRLPAAERAELLAAVELDADRLGALVADLLDAGRLEAGAVVARLQPVAGDEAIGAALDGLDPQARARVAVAGEDELPLLWADLGLLTRVLANLLDNALRHTASAVEVRGTTDDRTATLEVVDHGPGVPGDQRERMLAAFDRPEGAPEGGGTGLGLWVARGLTEAMGGRLEVGDTLGGGLTLRVRLPKPPARVVAR